jgi:hypothetical protein
MLLWEGMINQILGHERPKRLFYVLIALLSLYVLARSVVAAATKSLWYDEIITVVLSGQPSLKATWAALARAADAQPPTFYWIEKISLGLFSNKEVGARFPAILAMACTTLCIFAYLKRRFGEAIGFLGALLLLSTDLFTRYASEARPYSLLVACIAFAMVCYQRLPSGLWQVMLGLSLLLAGTFHYYSVFAIIPFGLAELVFFSQTKRFRWGVWLALICGCLPLVAFWPLLATVRAHYQTHFYSHFHLTTIPSTYAAFFLTDSAYGTALVATAIAGVLAWLYLVPPGDNEPAGRRPAEATLLIAMLALPLIVLPIVTALHGGIRGPYVMAAVLGVCLAVGTTLSIPRPAVVLLFGLFLCSNIAVREYVFWRSNHSLHFIPDSTALSELLNQSGYSDVPVVVSSGLRYTFLAYYATPDLFKRLYYLRNEQMQFRYEGTDTLDKHIVILARYLPLQITDFSDFILSHHTFLVYTEEPDDAGTWLPIYLSRTAASVRIVTMEQRRRLYLVTINGQ